MPGEVVDVIDRESLGCRLWEVSGEEAGGRGTAKVGGAKAGGVKVGGAKAGGAKVGGAKVGRGHHSQQESLCM